MKDSLGDRMKSYYEDRFRYKLPRKTYTIIRIDGKAFHTYTKGLIRPFDKDLMDDMDETTKYLCKNIQGVKFGYVQSDEISLLLTDFDDLQTDMWFDGNLQKMCSVAASMATMEFNRLRILRESKIMEDIRKPDDYFIQFPKKLAMFDARVFQVPSQIETYNYFVWRQQDATRNSISSVAQSLYSPKELNGVNSDQQQELIFQKGINWNDYSSREKRGGFIYKIEEEFNKDEYGFKRDNSSFYKRNIWKSIECPIFTQEREFLLSKIPNNL